MRPLRKAETVDEKFVSVNFRNTLIDMTNLRENKNIVSMYETIKRMFRGYYFLWEIENSFICIFTWFDMFSDIFQSSQWTTKDQPSTMMLIHVCIHCFVFSYVSIFWSVPFKISFHDLVNDRQKKVVASIATFNNNTYGNI